MYNRVEAHMYYVVNNDCILADEGPRTKMS